MLFDFASVKLENPQGWIEFDLTSNDLSINDKKRPLDTFSLRIVITANQQNGKDSRIRAVRFFGMAESLQGLK